MPNETIHWTPPTGNEEDKRELTAVHLSEINQPELAPGGPSDSSRRARQQCSRERYEIVGRELGLDAMVRVMRNDAGDESMLEKLRKEVVAK